MNFITQECNGNPLGMQTSQLISRNYADLSAARTSQGISDNLNRFITAHSRRNENQKWRKRNRYKEYLARDIESKSFSAHHFLCGPLNSNRLTRKSNSNNASSSHSSNFKDLYGTGEPIKPPWNEQQSTEKDGNSDTVPCNFSESFVQNLAPYLEQMGNFRVSVEQYVLSTVNELPDGRVPDPVHVDVQESCPLFDSSEYERDNDKPTTQCSDETPSPKRDRYRLFVGDELKRYIGTDDYTESVNIPIKNSIIRKPKTREDALVPILTSPDGQNISVS